MTLRRALAILPLFLAALLAQIYAPAGSSLAMGRAPTTASSLAAPCSAHDPHAPAGQDAPHSPGACCDLCEFVLSGAAAVASDVPQVAVRSAPGHRIAWAFPNQTFVGHARNRLAQARAPPFIS